MTLALRQRPLARVVQGIVAAANGAWFDPSDLSTLYQDAAGTTPVTAVEQPVGLHLDKSRGLQLGNEIVPDPTFSQWTDPSVPDGWIKTGTHNASNYVQESSSALRLVSDGTYIGVTTTSALTIGKTYRVKFDIVSSTMGSVAVLLGAGTDLIRSAPGSYSATIKATGTTIDVKRNAGSAVDIVVDNLSVRELPGYHATQSITASRPVLSARYNLLTKTEDFSDAVWTKNGVSVTTSRYLSPIGTFTANKVTLVSGAVTTGNDGAGAFASPVITANGSAYTLSLFAKSAGSNYIRFREATNTGQRVKINLIDGSFVGEENWSPSTFTVTVTPAPNGFFLIQITRSAPTTFCFNIKGGDDVGDGINGFYVWGADLRLSTTSGPYQRVNTATDYDTDERYFPKYLRFDGVDDYLNLPYMGLYAAGSASVVAGVSMRKVASATANEYLLTERNSTSVNPVYILQRRFSSGGGLSSFVRDDAGVSVVEEPQIIFAESSASVVTVVDNSTNIKSVINSSLKQTTNYTRAGTVTLNTTTIGASVATVNDGYSAMSLYGLIITKCALTDSQRIACERFEARKSGVLM